MISDLTLSLFRLFAAIYLFWMHGTAAFVSRGCGENLHQDTWCQNWPKKVSKDAFCFGKVAPAQPACDIRLWRFSPVWWPCRSRRYHLSKKNTSSLAFFGWFWHQVSWCRCSPHPSLRKSSMRAPTGRPHALPWASWSFGMRQKSWPLRNACTDIEVMLNATFEKDLGLPSRLPLSWTPWTHAWQTSLSVRNQDACDACRWTVLEMGTTLTDIWREDKQFSFRSQAEGWICWSLTLCLAIVANLTKSWPGWRPPMIRTSKLSLDSIEQWTGDLTDTWVVRLFGADNEFSTLRVANISSMQQWPGGLSDTCILRFFALAKEWRVWMEGPSWKLLDISCVGRI